MRKKDKYSESSMGYAGGIKFAHVVLKCFSYHLTPDHCLFNAAAPQHLKGSTPNQSSNPSQITSTALPAICFPLSLDICSWRICNSSDHVTLCACLRRPDVAVPVARGARQQVLPGLHAGRAAGLVRAGQLPAAVGRPGVRGAARVRGPDTGAAVARRVHQDQREAPTPAARAERQSASV